MLDQVLFHQLLVFKGQGLDAIKKNADSDDSTQEKKKKIATLEAWTTKRLTSH